MILFFSVKITDKRLSNLDAMRNPWFTKDNRFDVFKYCLSSYASIQNLFRKVILFVKLDEPYTDRFEEIEKYVFSIFDETEVHLFDHRLEHTNQWKNFCKEWLVDDSEVLWYSGNDDHIFIDYDAEFVKSNMSYFQNECAIDSMFGYSHYPEAMRYSVNRSQVHLVNNKNTIKWNNTTDTINSMTAVKSKRFKDYWEDANFGDQIIHRLDEFFLDRILSFSTEYISPTRELCRHHDGYNHIGYNNHIVPPLQIPPGFFENDIKISIGTNHRKSGYTTFNPNSVNLFAHNPDGCDYKWLESDIPFFWRDKISTIEYYDSNENMIDARNRHFIEKTRMPIANCHNEYVLPIDWFSNHIKVV